MTDQEVQAPKTPEQEARDMLERMGVEDAQYFTAGDVVELANLIAELRGLRVCDCGRPLSQPMCHVCDNDE